MELIDLVDKISSNIDHKKYNLGVFLDLSKAFDTTYHNVLINKLQCYGIRGTVLSATGLKATLITEDSMCHIIKQTQNI